MLTLDYCRELDVPIEVFANANANANALISNEAAGMTPGSPVRYGTAKADVYGYDQAMMMFQPVGGMDRIPAGVGAGHRPGLVRRGAEVSEVTDVPDGVRVTCRQGGRTKLITADFCIAALPPHSMAGVAHRSRHLEGAWTSPPYGTAGYDLLLRPAGRAISPVTGCRTRWPGSTGPSCRRGRLSPRCTSG